MTYGKRACKDMVKDTCNDMWSILVRKHRRMSSNDMMGTDLQLHEGNIHEMTWLGRTGKEAMMAELSFRCMVGHIQVENCQKIATSLRSAPRNDI